MADIQNQTYQRQPSTQSIIGVEANDLRKALCSVAKIDSKPWEGMYIHSDRPTHYGLCDMHFFPRTEIVIEIGGDTYTYGGSIFSIERPIGEHEVKFNKVKRDLQLIFPEFTRQLEALILYQKSTFNEYTLPAFLQLVKEGWYLAPLAAALCMFEGQGTEKKPREAIKLLEEHGGAEKVINRTQKVEGMQEDCGRLAYHVGKAYMQGKEAGLTYANPHMAAYFYDLACSLKYDVPSKELFIVNRECLENSLLSAEWSLEKTRVYDKNKIDQVLKQADSAKTYLEKGVGDDKIFQRESLDRIYWIKAQCYKIILDCFSDIREMDKHLKETLHHLALANQYGNGSAMRLAWKICFSATYKDHAEVTNGEYGLSYWVPIWTSSPLESYLRSILDSHHLGIDVAAKYESAYEKLGKEGNTILLYAWAVLLGELTREKVEAMEHMRPEIEQEVRSIRFFILYYSSTDKRHYKASLGHLYYRLMEGYDRIFISSYESGEKKKVMYCRMYLERELLDIYDEENQFIEDALLGLSCTSKIGEIDSSEKQRVVKCLKCFVEEHSKKLSKYGLKYAKEIIARIEHPFLSKFGFK